MWPYAAREAATWISAIPGASSTVTSRMINAITSGASNHAFRLQLRDLLRSKPQRLQDLVIVLAKVRRRRPDLTVEAGHLTRLRHQVDLAEARMRDGPGKAQR